MGVALPLSCHWALAHHWALFSYLRYVSVCAVFHTYLCCVPARGVAWATHSLPGVPGTGVLCGCKPGPTRVLPMPRQYGIGRRAPALRTLATSYDFKETWFIDVSSCKKGRTKTEHNKKKQKKKRRKKSKKKINK